MYDFILCLYRAQTSLLRDNNEGIRQHVNTFNSTNLPLVQLAGEQTRELADSERSQELNLNS